MTASTIAPSLTFTPADRAVMIDAARSLSRMLGRAVTIDSCLDDETPGTGEYASFVLGMQGGDDSTTLLTIVRTDEAGRRFVKLNDLGREGMAGNDLREVLANTAS